MKTELDPTKRIIPSQMSDKTLVDTLLFLQSDLNEAKKLKLESRMELKKELLNLVKDEIYLRMKKAG